MVHPRILIINDEAALRYLFRYNLSARGYEVKDIIGSPDAFSIFQREQPDMVILDMTVYGTDGFELCRQICDSNVSSVIAFNMRGSGIDLLRCLEMGVDDYLGRPFGIDELMARINAVFRHRRFNKSPEPV